MGRKLSEEELDAMVDAAMEAAKSAPDGPYIAFAQYHVDGQFLEMKLTNGRRLLVPREELGELANATDEQAADLVVLKPATALYWPQLDDGLHLNDFLEYRWRREPESVAA
jgi:hypothetical protein